ncbi:hypothetical protein FOMA001_g17995 [Fusarium oxysporum f. sp. matthiolae]|nr:hypothetical protein FOMA001_g17995 [Fusarium oxysporum f. sp. matthiolae]
MDPFVYLPEYPFIFCSECKVGFVVSEVLGHLKANHGNITRQKMKSIRQEVASIQGIAKDQAELKGWAPPPSTTQPNIYIGPPHKDGLGCDRCSYVVRDMQRMQKHYQTEHSWVNHRKRGRQKRQPQEGHHSQPWPWRTQIQCQQVCHWGHGRRWFEVGRAQDQNNSRGSRGGGREEEQEEEDNVITEHEAAVAFFRSIQEEDEKAFESEANARIQEGHDKYEAVAWLN